MHFWPWKIEGGFHSYGGTRKWMVCSGNILLKWMMTGGTPMTQETTRCSWHSKVMLWPLAAGMRMRSALSTDTLADSSRRLASPSHQHLMHSLYNKPSPVMGGWWHWVPHWGHGWQWLVGHILDRNRLASPSWRMAGIGPKGGLDRNQPQTSEKLNAPVPGLPEMSHPKSVLCG